jgi:two-component system chemotaxis response regulator CheB
MAFEHHVIVVGASAGGVHALLRLAAALPGGFAAPVCIVQHIGGNPSLLPELLRYRGSNPARHVQDGDLLTPGTLHVAPPDCHLLVEGETLRLSHGPKENHARPAIDPLFRSAALSHGARVIGVVLTGQMDDGTAGLQAVKDCGGIAVVQDPATAEEPEMPRSALAHVAVDHCVALEAIAPLLQRLVQPAAAAPPAAPAPRAPENVVREVAINRGDAAVEQLEPVANPSTLTCPDCGGSLWEMKDARPVRYRCHTGHAFSPLSLQRAQQDAAEEALWSAVRALREREFLLRRMAAVATTLGDENQASAAGAEADRLQQHSLALQQLADGLPAPHALPAAA